MRKEYKLFIKDILDAINDIEESTRDMEFKNFLEDKKTKRAVVQGIAVIANKALKMGKKEDSYDKGCIYFEKI